MVINVKKTAFNETFYPYLYSPEAYQIYYGGRGGGKSNNLMRRYIIKAMRNEYFRLVYCRKDFTHVRKSMFDGFKMQIADWKLEKYFQCNNGDMRIKCLLSGNEMIPAGMNNPDSIKSIAEPTDIWCEEFYQFKRDDFENLDNSLRTERARTQFTASFNPTSSKSWIKKYFFDNAHLFRHGTLLLHKSTYKDNRFINQSLYEDKLNRLSGAKRQSDMFGDWGDAEEGLVYEYKTANVIPESANDVFYGVDFGFSNSKTAIVKCHADRNRKVVYVKEVLYKTGLLTSSIINIIKQEAQPYEVPFYCDSAEPQMIQEIFNARINAKKSKKEIIAGIDYVKEWQLIVLDGSPNLVMELDGYKWAKDKNDNFVNLPEKGDDHLCDALRYAIFTHLSTPKTIISI